MKGSPVQNLPHLSVNRKNLRNKSTSAEVKLWGSLQKKKLDGRKFKRQNSIGNYIVDFYCPSEKLAIELDGEDHFWEEGIKRDKVKTDYLKNLGIRIVRFENKWVFEDLEFVLDTIRKSFMKGIHE